MTIKFTTIIGHFEVMVTDTTKYHWEDDVFIITSHGVPVYKLWCNRWLKKDIESQIKERA